MLKTSDVPYAKIAMYASSVIRQDNCWVLFFYTMDSKDYPSSSVIGRATECIGGPAIAQWVVDSEPVLQPGSKGEWDDKQVLAPHVLKADSGYRMYYSGSNASGKQRIGMATSEDGIHWIKYNDPATVKVPFVDSDPVFQAGEVGVWDGGFVHQPRVFQTLNGWVMIYRGTKNDNGEKMALGIATSPNGIHWTRSASNPVFEPHDIPKAAYIWFDNVLLVNDTYYLFVEGDVNKSTQIYLATHQGKVVP